MIHQVVAVGPLQCNCHILADEASKEAVIVDPGDDAEEILRRVKGYKVLSLLHTHCHFDHMTGTRKVAEATGAEILIHKADKEYYDSLAAQYEMFGMPRPVDDPLPVKRFLKDGDRIAFGRQALKVIHTPGHTRGSCCFHTEGLVLSGDTLFQGSVGRTDLPGGNSAEELDSIRTKLYSLDRETVVYPGHGPETTIAQERADNPFVSD
jgi:glyoxylase-like metal-dependent hydrolase (beta-lactamase superfamily II)